MKARASQLSEKINYLQKLPEKMGCYSEKVFLSF